MNASSEQTSLDQLPVEHLKGVGPKVAERLHRIGVSQVQDVLFHLPLRYQDRTRIRDIASLRHGEQVVIEGVVQRSDIRFGRRRSLLVQLADATASLQLRFFHFSQAQRNGMASGTSLRCFGEVRRGPQGYEMVHPEVQNLDRDPAPLEQALTPIYPTTEGLHQLSWRRITDAALALLEQHPDWLPEWLPPDILRQLKLPKLSDALTYLHRPPVDAPQASLLDGEHPAQRRLVFEELLAHQMSLRLLRQRKRRQSAPSLRGDGKLSGRLLQGLPFALTGAQQRVVEEIAGDMHKAHPMLRLVQGDVGSGKTVVAALAALQAVEAGHQVAVMAPTELLAEQHLANFQGWLEPLGVRIGWLTGRHKGRKRDAVLQPLSQGEIDLVVGTHALFQEDVQFFRLGLVVIDEQHRFGVHQRMALRQKGGGGGQLPHQLIMTATPIPRTLAMTAYADLELSVIDELPPGRTPVSTVAIPDSRRDQVMQRVEAACGEGKQAYWVCTLIEESEALQCQAAEETARELTELLPGLRVGLVHGRLKSAEKAEVMERFKLGEIDLLVATTVIEVGVDVPNASLMVIENPERLGLAQLHQLRGRVGRGSAASHCVLMFHPPLGEGARERLGVLRESSDGFYLAQKDLELRGPGEVLGTRQTGEMQFRIADLVRDQPLLPQVQHYAELMLAEYPQQVEPLVRRWVGQRERYLGA